MLLSFPVVLIEALQLAGAPGCKVRAWISAALPWPVSSAWPILLTAMVLVMHACHPCASLILARSETRVRLCVSRSDYSLNRSRI